MRTSTRWPNKQTKTIVTGLIVFFFLFFWRNINFRKFQDGYGSTILQDVPKSLLHLSLRSSRWLKHPQFPCHSWPKQYDSYVPWSKLDCIRIFRDGHHSISRNLYTHVQGLPDDGGIIITHIPCFDHGTYDSYLWRHWPWIFWLNSPCDFLPSQSGGQIRMWTAASGLTWMTWMPSLCRLWREICGTRLIDLELRIV